MSTTALQAKRAITVIPSDTIDIPLPGPYLSGLNANNANPNNLVGQGDFIASGVSVGDIVYNNTSLEIYTVLDVIDATTLEVCSLCSSFVGADDAFSYSIYSPGNNNGATLYVGGAGDLTVITMGGDQVTFTAAPAGAFLPIQVTRVLSTGTTATNILALW